MHVSKNTIISSYTQSPEVVIALLDADISYQCRKFPMTNIFTEIKLRKTIPPVSYPSPDRIARMATIVE